MTIAIILGTRPEIIKMDPVIRECQRHGSVIPTGLLCSRLMDYL
jgi:UDP-N-acetylglucosamine 2-epimerase (non-hydrolysing)